MSESGLYPVQNWLWSELDDLGIDGVIYSRHILDLLISSKHTVDFRLAEKEQNIFSKITPGSKRRKHKYSKRSSSFSACEEILWKKENAVACLLSAADAKTNSDDTINTIQQVIDELYAKLAGLHLTSDGRKANSDGDYSLMDHNGNKLKSVTNTEPEKKNGETMATTKKKENYEDAFPSLEGSSVSPVLSIVSDSVWMKPYQKNEFKSGCDSDNAPQTRTPKSSENTDPTEPCPAPNPKVVQERAKCTSAPTFTQSISSTNDDVFHDAPGKRRPKKLTTYPPYSKGGARRFPRKRRPNPDVFGGTQTCYEEGRQPRRYIRKRLNENTRIQSRGRSVGFGKDGLKSPMKFRVQNTARNDKHPPNGGKKAWKRDANGVKSLPNVKFEERLPSEVTTYACAERAHLPSWMETTIADMGSSYVWLGGGAPNNDYSSKEFSEQDLQEMAFSSKWYRDPETGLLTFHPSQSTLRSTSSSSVSRTSLSGSEEDDLLQEVMLDDGEPVAPESWMWCPSPSLWEEDQSSPVSRLQSVYKRGLLSLGSEQANVDDISGRIWEEYKTIFLDLQDMNGGSDAERGRSSDQDEKEAEKFSPGSWTEDRCPAGGADAQLGFLPITDPNETGKLDFEDVTLSHLAWINDAPTSGYAQAPLRPVVTTAGNTVTTSHVGNSSDIWNYPVRTDAWSAGDDSPPSDSDIQRSREEVTRLLERGTFGLLCDGYASKRGDWMLPGTKESTHEIWGGGDMPALKKAGAVADALEEERLMNHLVDAMFSDLSFELFFGSQQYHEDVPVLPQKFTGAWRDSIQNDLTDNSYPTLSFDMPSLFFQSPIENLHFLHSDTWQTKWSIDDLFSDGGLAGLSSLANLDRLFVSLASADHDRPLESTRRHALENAGYDRSHKKTFLDSVTENDAWKTSLRIGNIWQNISGIRPVNVIYSENKPGPTPNEKLIPSSQTHFRPISATPGLEIAEASVTTYSDTGTMPANGDSLYGGAGQQSHGMAAQRKTQQVAESFEGKELSFDTHFGKPVQDKSMQTAFELALQRDVSSCQQLCARPPKANSR